MVRHVPETSIRLFVSPFHPHIAASHLATNTPAKLLDSLQIYSITSISENSQEMQSEPGDPPIPRTSISPSTSGGTITAAVEVRRGV